MTWSSTEMTVKKRSAAGGSGNRVIGARAKVNRPYQRNLYPRRLLRAIDSGSMLPEDVQLVSVNDHLVEPPDLWTARLPAGPVHSAPYLDRTGGREVWRIGSYFLPVAEMAVMRADRDPERRAERFEDVHPAVMPAGGTVGRHG